MDYAALKAEIANDPALLSLAPDSAAIAATLSQGRKKIINREIGEGLISDALGIPAGPVFIKALRDIAAAPLAQDATAEQIAQKATIEQAQRLIARASLDVGMESVRAGIDAFVGVLPLTQDQANAIKALAEVPDPIGELDVRRAIWNDDGSRAL